MINLDTASRKVYKLLSRSKDSIHVDAETYFQGDLSLSLSFSIHFT